MTKLTLRKADKIAKATLEAARRVSLTPMVAVSVYSEESLGSVADAARADLRENIALSKTLFDAAYDLRGLIGDANREAGIDALLTEKARLDAEEKALNGLSASTTAGRRSRRTVSTDFAVAEKQRDALKARLSSDNYQGYGAEETISVTVLDDSLTSELDARLTAIRKRKIAIDDRLLELNTSTKIALGDDVVQTLEAQGLI